MNVLEPLAVCVLDVDTDGVFVAVLNTVIVDLNVIEELDDIVLVFDILELPLNDDELVPVLVENAERDTEIVDFCDLEGCEL